VPSSSATGADPGAAGGFNFISMRDVNSPEKNLFGLLPCRKFTPKTPYTMTLSL
jgi:hypothetical protein